MRAYNEVLQQAVSSKEQEAKTSQKSLRIPNQPGFKLNEYALKKQDERVGNLEQQIKEYKALLAQKDAECEDLRKRNTSVDSDLTKGLDALRQAQNEIERLESEKSALVDHCEEHGKKNQDSEAQLAAQSQDLEKLQKIARNCDFLEQREAELLDKLCQKEEAFLIYQNENTNTIEKIKEYESRQAQLENDLEVATTEASTNLLDKENLQRQVEDLEASLENINQENEELHREVEKRLSQIRECDSEIGQLKSDTRDVAEMKGEIQKMKERHNTELYQLQDAYKRAQNRIETAESELFKRTSEVTTLKNTLNRQEDLIEATNEGVRYADSATQDIKAQLDQEIREANALYEMTVN